MKQTTKILVEEHKNILKIVEKLEKECEAIASGKPVDNNFFTKAIDFIRNYADKFHHAKEEDILFKEFKKCADEGCVHCDPTEQMLHEHNIGRDFIKGIEEGLNELDKRKIVKNSQGYVQLIKEHIFKEDHILYPMAEEALDKKIQASMLKKFKKIANQKKQEIKKYLKFVEEL